MKIFVTGGSGFIGRRLVEKLSQNKDDQIFCLTRDLSKISISTAENVQYLEGDITKPETYKNFLYGSDRLYHLAAYVGYGIYGRDKKEMGKINIDGTKIIFDIAKQFKIPKILYLSTAMVYHPMGEKIVVETDNFPKKHTTHYSYTKYLSFLEAQKYIKIGLPITVILPTSVYGYGSPLFSDFVKFLLKYKVFFKSLLDKRLSVVYVNDVVDAILLAEKGDYVGESFIVSSEIITIRDFIKQVEIYFKIEVKIYNLPIFILKLFSPVIGFISRFKKGLYINKEIFNFINGNFIASGEKVKNKLEWKPKTSIYNKFEEMI